MALKFIHETPLDKLKIVLSNIKSDPDITNLTSVMRWLETKHKKDIYSSKYILMYCNEYRKVCGGRFYNSIKEIEKFEYRKSYPFIIIYENGIRNKTLE